MSTFRSSRPAVLELAARYHELITQMGKKDAKTEAEVDEAEKILFMEMCEICLWGNATDLSLLTSLTYEDIQKLQGSEARKASEKNIIVNDLGAAYDVLKKAKKEGKKESGGRTRTTIRAVTGEERTEEVARMLSGAKLTETSRKHAEQMIKANG